MMSESTLGMDQYKARLRKLKLASESVKRRTSIYSEISNIDNKHTAKSMSVLRNAPDPGGKIQKIGFIIFWIPEPFGITNAIGAPMILAGKYLEKKYNGSTLHDVGKTTKSNAHVISSFRDAVF